MEAPPTNTGAASGSARSEPPAQVIPRRTLKTLGFVAALLVLVHLGMAFWSRHAWTEVESIVCLHARMLANGQGIYYDFNQYPFTVSVYGPVFYLAAAALHTLGLPILIAGRLISFLAFLGIVYLSWRLLDLYTSNHYATWTGTLLVASTSNIVKHGVTAQVDELGVFFSLAAFFQYSKYRADSKTASLAWTAALLVLAVFTKQSFVAAGAAIVLLLAATNLRQALRFALIAGICGAALALGLNLLTEGRYFDNAFLANLNPFSQEKFFDHAKYLILTEAGLIIIALAGLRRAFRGQIHPFYVYLLPATLVFLLTAPKLGSDIHYQLEMVVALSLCAAWTLHELNFFPLLFRHDPGWVTLLEIPLLLQLVMNPLVSGQALLERAAFELARRAEAVQLEPYFSANPGRVLCVEMDALLQAGKPIEVEPLIYNWMVGAGLTDPEPVRRDLADAKFALIVLYQDLFSNTVPSHPELPSLPEAHLDEIRKHYSLVAHVPGPFWAGAFVYQPIRPGASE